MIGDAGQVMKKTVAIIYADTNCSNIGTESNITKPIGGRNVLGCTVGRLRQCKLIDEIVVFCPAEQQSAIGDLLGAVSSNSNVAGGNNNEHTVPEVILHGLSERIAVNKRVRFRKWGLNSWRGGLGEATYFDEQRFCGEMVAFLANREAHTVYNVPAEAAFVCPELSDEIIKHHKEHTGEMRFTFSQSPPGLAGCVYRLDMLNDITVTGGYIGDVLAYNPDSPHADYIVQECAYKVGPEIYSSAWRYIADTRRGLEAMQQLSNNAGGEIWQWPAAKIISCMEEQNRRERYKLPREVEIEIEAETSSLRIKGYPHRHEGKAGDIIRQRGRMSKETFAHIAEQTGQYDDVCITIGGFGEPLGHPELIEFVEIAHKAGVLGINIETDGQLLEGKLAERLLQSDADIISVYIDANSEAVYEQAKGQINGQVSFEKLAEQLDDFTEKSKQNNGPVIVPHLVKTRATMADMEGFYDRWIRKCKAAVIVGYNDYAGQIESKAVMNMCPPQRRVCRRLLNDMMILANGEVVICNQDFKGQCVAGNVNESSLQDIWRSEVLEVLREKQYDGKYKDNKLCAKCRDWHR